jgi:hypothetical protein
MSAHRHSARYPDSALPGLTLAVVMDLGRERHTQDGLVPLAPGFLEVPSTLGVGKSGLSLTSPVGQSG